MRIEELRLNEAPEDFWRLTARSGAASVFYNPTLLSLWEAHFGWRGVVLAAGRTFLPGFAKPSALGSQFWSLPFGWYGGLFTENWREDEVSALLQHIAQNHKLEISLVQFGRKITSTKESGLDEQSMTTHLLDLGSSNRYSDNVTRNIAKAQSSGLAVADLAATQVNEALQLLQAHEKLTDKPRKIKHEFYRGLLDVACEDTDAVEAISAMHEDKLIACHIYLQSATDIFYLDGFSDEAGRDLSANFLIFDEAIREARLQGKQRLNFGATPKGDENLKRFKESWGARPVEYHHYHRRGGLKKTIDKMRGRA